MKTDFFFYTGMYQANICQNPLDQYQYGLEVYEHSVYLTLQGTSVRDRGEEDLAASTGEQTHCNIALERIH